MFEKHIADLMQALVAGIGGVIAALMRKETHGLSETIIAGAGAMFLGFIVAKICRISGLNEDTAIILTSLSGWLGAERTSRYLERMVTSRLGIPDEDEKKDDTK